MSGGDLGDLLAWAREQPWARDMRNCPQDPEWHAEGDVWTHTELVCEALQTLPEWPDLPSLDRVALSWAALLHDVAKPRVTSLDENGRLRSPGHGRLGSRIARELLAEFGAGYSLRETVCELIRYHSRPPNIHRESDPERFVVATSWLADTRLLYLLECADLAGRRGSGIVEGQAWVEHWRETCEAMRCFGTPYPFNNDHARVLFYHDQLSALDYEPHVADRFDVTLVAGLPGVGKSTWISAERVDHPIVELDRIRAELGIPPEATPGRVIQTAMEACRVHLRARRPFSFVATNVVEITRRRWLDLFLSYGANVEIVYLEQPMPIIVRRNRDRPQSVPESIITRLWRKLDPPTAAEAHRLHLITQPTSPGITLRPPDD